MQAKLSRDIRNYYDKSRQELFEFLSIALEELIASDSIMIENSNANAAMTKDYMSLFNKCKIMEEEIKNLKVALEKSINDNQFKTSDIYGRSTEKLSDVVDSAMVTEIIDEDMIETPEADVKTTSFVSFRSRQNTHGKRTSGKREKDFANLPKINVYEININELNSLYGENNWRISYWRAHRTVECNPAMVYEKISYIPVISVGLEHLLCSVPRENVLISNSVASASLAALIFYNKFFLALPIYRQETYFKNLGLTLSRQTMNNWVNRLSMEIFSLVYDRMTQLLMQIEYHQCDETYFQVNKDGREAGSKSFMWVHISNELINTHPLIVYCFELTRGTDHLRKFYQDFKGYITCDAYISYHVLEKEHKDEIVICGCMMHLRRRFIKSLSLINTKSLDNDAIEALHETKVLKLIGRIYDEDEPLKTLSADNRKEQREQKVRPLINEFYEYIENIDVTDPLIGYQLKDAIQYAKNQKNYICRFLDNGNVPIDDGATERAIRPFSIGRNNWIACDSIVGAECAAIMYTIVETAKANKANVYQYLRYLLEEVPKHLNYKSFDFLDDMLPWSEKYLAYENTQIMSTPTLVLKENEYDTRPKTPHKSDNSDHQNQSSA